MGFAFDEGTGLPVVVKSGGEEQPPPPPSLTLHVEREPAESQIGDIMLRVQRFADETADEARRQARAIIADAHVEAANIVTRARREAEDIKESAVPQIAPDGVDRLCRAIEEFALTNQVLVGELNQLRQALKGSYADTPVAPEGRLSSVPPAAG